VIIHADEVASPSRPNGYNPSSPDGQETGDEQSFWTRGKARVETFVVGGDVIGGEKLQWIVEGGKYKASFLLEDKTEDGGWKNKGEGTGCLISETVVPGFEYEDHDFLKRERAEVLLSREQLEEMGWMLRVD
jgi:predicted cupin superfamily sugar epimerase